MPLRGEGEHLHESRAQQLLVVSLAVTLNKIRDSAFADATDEITSIRHEKAFHLGVFRDRGKIHQDCQTITQDMIERCKEY